MNNYEKHQKWLRRPKDMTGHENTTTVERRFVIPFVLVCHSIFALNPAFAQSTQTSSAAEVPSSAAKTSKLFPPRVIQAVDAIYPAEALVKRLESRVELIVTVRSDGSVGEVLVASSGGEAFDEAAILAVQQWSFEPARRGARTLDSRIRVPFQFALPKPTPAPAPPKITKTSTPATTSTSKGDQGNETPIDVTVRGTRKVRTEERSVSDFKIERDILSAAPRQEGAEVLRAAPGVYIGRSEGPAVAHNYMLRGFDAEHGQDIEFRVAGLPINLPSHVHGQGYSDLGFLIGDVVQELQVTEGVYDPRQGDFAVAGSIELKLGIEEKERGLRLRTGYGSWNSFRQLLLWAPPDADEESFGAVQYFRTDGFGENRDAQAASAIFQHRFGEGSLTYRAIGILHTVRSNIAGVVRQDDVSAKRICLTCTYPFPTAKGQNGLASRFITGLFSDYFGNDGENGQLGIWFGYDIFRNQGNFTGFLQQSRSLERVGGRGDLIEQQNRSASFGLTGRYRTTPFRTKNWGHGTFEVGSDGRLDLIDQAQNLIDAAVRNQTWDRRVDASIEGTDLGFWSDLDWHFNRHLNARAGLIANLLSYTVDDRLGNFAPLTRPQDTFITGFRRSAAGLAWGPRTSLEIKTMDWMSILAAYGEAYRSPQARLLEDGESAPFTKVTSADMGVRFDWGDALHLSLGGYYTHLSDDVAFDASEGRPEPIGATQRIGAMSHAVSRPFPWLVATVSVTYVDATLLEPPAATAQEPQPQFTKGQNQPFVPPLVVRTDIGAKHTLIQEYAGHPLTGRAGLGFSFLSSRPLPYGDFSEPVALLDLSAALSWGAFELAFEIFNALDASYAATEYTFPSDWNPDDGVRSRTPARHLAAGSPLSWTISLGASL